MFLLSANQKYPEAVSHGCHNDQQTVHDVSNCNNLELDTYMGGLIFSV